MNPPERVPAAGAVDAWLALAVHSRLVASVYLAREAARGALDIPETLVQQVYPRTDADFGSPVDIPAALLIYTPSSAATSSPECHYN